MTTPAPPPAPTRDEIEALARSTPASGPRRSPWLVAAAATLGSFLFGYDTGVISGALPYMLLPRHAGGLALSSFEKGWVEGFLCLGAALGATTCGRLADRYGRRHNLSLLGVVLALGALGCSLAPTTWALFLFRVVVGYGVGGASAIVPSYLGETAPKRIRGRLIATDQMMIVIGQFVAYGANALIAVNAGGPDAAAANGGTWRLMLVLATLPAVGLWIGIRRMPESARWYAADLRIAEAIGSLKRVRSAELDGPVADEIDEMLRAGRREAAREHWGFRRIWGTRWTRRLLLIGLVLGVGDQVTGINTAMYYTPQVLRAAGFSSIDSITLPVISGGIAALGAMANLWAVGRFARRHVGIYQEGAIVVCLTALAGVFHFLIEPHQGADGDIDASAVPAFAPVLVLVIICLFVFSKQSGTVSWVLISELFPSRIRGTAVGMAIGVLWIANAAVAVVFPPMMDHLGGAATYLVFAAMNVGTLLFYWRVVPETRGSSLEELESRFARRYR